MRKIFLSSAIVAALVLTISLAYAADQKTAAIGSPSSSLRRASRAFDDARGSRRR